VDKGDEVVAKTIVRDQAAAVVIDTTSTEKPDVFAKRRLRQNFCFSRLLMPRFSLHKKMEISLKLRPWSGQLFCAI
jgi:hypothetical protein